MPSSPSRSRLRYLRDLDVLLAAVVALTLLLLSGGLLWLAYAVHVWRIARRSPVTDRRADVLLVFGRRLVADAPERDYRARLTRALALARAGQVQRMLLLGGFSGSRCSEAEAGLRWLLQQGLPPTLRVELEQASVDSLENLRHARRLLQGADPAQALPPVLLLTSRYHLARCLFLARRLGFDAAPLAAEEQLPCTPRYLVRLLVEAGYLMWTDVGVRWGQWVGPRRMATRIS